MATKKIVYIARDGKEFKTEQECDAHEAYLRLAIRIEDYVTSAGLGKAQAGLMRRHIAGYVAHTERLDAARQTELAEMREPAADPSVA